jgi:hypothetical protein
MQKKQIKVGAKYTVKVSGKLTTVTVVRESEYRTCSGAFRTKWICTNDRTGRRIDVKSAVRFRSLAVGQIVAGRTQSGLEVGGRPWADAVAVDRDLPARVKEALLSAYGYKFDLALAWSWHQFSDLAC